MQEQLKQEKIDKWKESHTFSNDELTRKLSEFCCPEPIHGLLDLELMSPTDLFELFLMMKLWVTSVSKQTNMRWIKGQIDGMMSMSTNYAVLLGYCYSADITDFHRVKCIGRKLWMYITR